MPKQPTSFAGNRQSPQPTQEPSGFFWMAVEFDDDDTLCIQVGTVLVPGTIRIPAGDTVVGGLLIHFWRLLHPQPHTSGRTSTSVQDLTPILPPHIKKHACIGRRVVRCWCAFLVAGDSDATGPHSHAARREPDNTTHKLPRPSPGRHQPLMRREHGFHKRHSSVEGQTTLFVGHSANESAILRTVFLCTHTGLFAKTEERVFLQERSVNLAPLQMPQF